MSDKISISDVLVDDDDNTWSDGASRDLKCPICNFNYQHVGTPTVIDGQDVYKAGWDGRGDLIVIPVNGECGHKWELCFGFHKGNTAAFARLANR